jgi:hypothetical protein
MNRSPTSRSLCAGVLAAAALAGAWPSADAAVYRGRFTPEYGAPFPDLYWDGAIEVFAPDGCVPASAQRIALNSCAGMKITEASVNLYDKADKLTVLQTMAFADAVEDQPNGLSGLSGLNWLLDFADNERLIGANSTAFPAIEGSIAETMYQGNQAWFSLQFLGNFAQLYWFDKEPGVTPLFGIPDEVALTAGIKIGDHTYGGICREFGGTRVPWPVNLWVAPDSCGWSDPDGISKDGAFITFEKVVPDEVPEPATYALVPAALAALGLAGLLSKRRRRLAAGR